MPESWFILRHGPGDSARNMATDHALMESASAWDRPVLRFYRWREAAATFGYSQKIAAIEKATLLRPLIRRPTGGGLVPHDHDWTYSIALPPSHSWYGIPAVESYKLIHEWLRAAFLEMGVETELSPETRHEIPGQCFAGAEKFDLLWHGRKIAGAAQRRTRGALLTQGSVRPPPIGLIRDHWETAMINAGAALRHAAFEPLEPDDRFEKLTRSLTESRYSRDDYNRRR
jgi:lipoate-protein ligase A